MSIPCDAKNYPTQEKFQLQAGQKVDSGSRAVKQQRSAEGTTRYGVGSIKNFRPELHLIIKQRPPI